MSFTAYAAGFFDGEGTVDLRYRRTHGGKYERFELRLQIAQVDTRPLMALQAQFGGSICKPKMLSASRLCIVGHDARAFLTAVRPYLITKAEEADIGLAFFQLVEDTPNHWRKGQHRFNRTAPEIMAQKIIYFHEMRAVRERKGFCITRRKNVNLGR